MENVVNGLILCGVMILGREELLELILCSVRILGRGELLERGYFNE